MKTAFLALTFAGILALPAATFAAGNPAPSAMPDFTKGNKPGEAHDWTLGPTGARGWIFTANGHSHDARQILVTEVAKGSPADGALNVDDVILGVEGKNFSADARSLFGGAIACAQTT